MQARRWRRCASARWPSPGDDRRARVRFCPAGSATRAAMTPAATIGNLLRRGRSAGDDPGAVLAMGGENAVEANQMSSGRDVTHLMLRHPRLGCSRVWASAQDGKADDGPPQGRASTDRLFEQKRSAFAKLVRRLCALAGVPQVCPHSLRGLWATLAVESGQACEAVAAALGHGSFATTSKHYATPSSVHSAQSDRAGEALFRNRSEDLDSGAQRREK